MSDATLSGLNYSVQADQIEVFDAMAQLLPSSNTWEFTMTTVLWDQNELVRKTVQFEELDILAKVGELIWAVSDRGTAELVEMLVISPVIATMMYAQRIMTIEHYRTVHVTPCRLDSRPVTLNRLPLPVRIVPNAIDYLYFTDRHGYPV